MRAGLGLLGLLLCGLVVARLAGRIAAFPALGWTDDPWRRRAVKDRSRRSELHSDPDRPFTSFSTVDELLRSAPMIVIPQRELRNNVSEVLRRAEGGEQFTITVAGRPVAQLGPPRGARRPAACAADLRRILASTPVDPGWAGDLARMRDEDTAGSRDPWQP